MRVLAVVAHPDDDVLGPGGTLLRHVAEGDEVRVLMVCTAPSAQYRMTGHRLLDAAHVARDGGWELIAGGQPTLDLDIATVTELVEANLDTDTVYTHHADLNRDHRTIHEAVKVATRPWVSGITAVRTFNTPSASELGEPFAPDHFVAIDLARKTALLARYASELHPAPHPRSQGAVEAHAAFWGSHVGLAAAEPFVTLWERR